MNKLKTSLKTGLQNRIYNEDDFINKIVKEQKDIYLNRLKQQYLTFIQISKLNNEGHKTINASVYSAMRLFCLDCSLLSFAEIEVMENECDNLYL